MWYLGFVYLCDVLLFPFLGFSRVGSSGCFVGNFSLSCWSLRKFEPLFLRF